MDKLIYIVYPALLILLLWGAKRSGKGEWNDGFLSLPQTKAIQGFAVMIVIMHHLSHRSSASWVPNMYHRTGLEAFVNVGYLCVAIFFFCSGYGLYKSLKSKPDYLVGFFSKRVALLVVTFYTSEIIYLIVRALLGEKLNPMLLLAYITGAKQTNPNAWYSIILPLLYIFFYIGFKLFKKDTQSIGFIIFATAVYTILSTFVNHNDWIICGEWWFNTVHMFWVGIVFAKNEKSIVPFVKKHYKLLLTLSIILVPVSVGLAGFSIYKFSYYYGEYSFMPVPRFDAAWRRWICLAAQILVSCNFTFLTILISLKVKIGNKALAFLGGMTLEIYLIHGLFLHMFSYAFVEPEIAPSLYYIKNLFLFTVVVIALSLIASVPYKHLHNLIMKKISRK